MARKIRFRRARKTPPRGHGRVALRVAFANRGSRGQSMRAAYAILEREYELTNENATQKRSTCAEACARGKKEPRVINDHRVDFFLKTSAAESPPGTSPWPFTFLRARFQRFFFFFFTFDISRGFDAERTLRVRACRTSLNCKVRRDAAR